MILSTIRNSRKDSYLGVKERSDLASESNIHEALLNLLDLVLGDAVAALLVDLIDGDLLHGLALVEDAGAQFESDARGWRDNISIESLTW